MLGPNLDLKSMNMKWDRKYENLIYINSNKNKFDIIDGVITIKLQDYFNIVDGHCNCNGCRKSISTVGLDGYSMTNSDFHFYKKEDEPTDTRKY